ncbi:MAG: hypothetical protein ACRC35_00550 [Angustibacter sp.]
MGEATASAMALVALDRAAVATRGTGVGTLVESLCAVTTIQLAGGDDAGASASAGECADLVRPSPVDAVPDRLWPSLTELFARIAERQHGQDVPAAIASQALSVELRRRAPVHCQVPGRPLLADLLHRLSVLQLLNQDPAAAAATAAEVVDVGRRTIAGRPEGSLADLADLADHLGHLSAASGGAGDRETARAAAAEEADIRRRLLVAGHDDQLAPLIDSLMLLSAERRWVHQQATAAATGAAVERVAEPRRRGPRTTTTGPVPRGPVRRTSVVG